jgi:hypothetical protein
MSVTVSTVVRAVIATYSISGTYTSPKTGPHTDKTQQENWPITAAYTSAQMGPQHMHHKRNDASLWDTLAHRLDHNTCTTTRGKIHHYGIQWCIDGTTYKHNIKGRTTHHYSTLMHKQSHIQTHTTQQEEPPIAMGYISARQNHILKDWSYENGKVISMKVQFEHLMMTISVETCTVKSYEVM